MTDNIEDSVTISSDLALRLVKAAKKYAQANREHGIALHSLDVEVRTHAAGKVYACDKALMNIVAEIGE